MKIEAKTLQEAITKASEELGCSVVDLKIDVIQHPSSGILGFFKKTAIINAYLEKFEKNTSKSENSKKEHQKKSDLKQSNSVKKSKTEKPNKSEKSNKIEKAQNTEKIEKAEKAETSKKPARKSVKKERVEIESVLSKIESDIKDLFAKSFFDITSIEVSKFDEKTVYVKLDGSDAALLIGKEGSRYKAISTLLHNLLNLKYGLFVRLEISEFYENQEKMISNYLKDIIEKVEKNSKAQTRPLDGILIKIALEQLKEKFPEKYIGVRTSKNGKFIIINDKIKKA